MKIVLWPNLKIKYAFDSDNNIFIPRFYKFNKTRASIPRVPNPIFII